jgi:hypothetical protein
MTDIIGKSQQQIQFEEQNLDLELMILTLLLSLTRRGLVFNEHFNVRCITLKWNAFLNGVEYCSSTTEKDYVCSSALRLFRLRLLGLVIFFS